MADAHAGRIGSENQTIIKWTGRVILVVKLNPVNEADVEGCDRKWRSVEGELGWGPVAVPQLVGAGDA